MINNINHIIIIGGGESGVGAALLAKKKGFQVFVSDASSISSTYKTELDQFQIAYEENGHQRAKKLTTELIIKSPGVPDDVPIIKFYTKKGIPIISEIEFASWYTNACIIGITGTNGKTTTSLLTHHILRTGGLNVSIAGNIGQSFARQVIQDTPDYYVLELSSFQLEGLQFFKPDIAILLNITPDHLDRYDYKLKKYITAKFQILKNSNIGTRFIYYQDDINITQYLAANNFSATPVTISLNDDATNGYADQEFLYFSKNSFARHQVPINNLPLKGNHNKINMLAAGLVGMQLNIPIATIEQGLKTFKNHPHRLEFVSSIDGVTYINDSKATNVEAVKYALESIQQPFIWIAGGVDKGNDYNLINNYLGNIKGLICLGKETNKLQSAIKNYTDNIYVTESIDQAVAYAQGLASSGDVVILSPACASFDLFKNYEDRGDQFKKAVLNLQKKEVID